MYWIVRDYVGHVSEDSVRRNFLLIYELLDEILDYGFPQNSSTERLKQFIAMEPVVCRPRTALLGNASLGGSSSSSAASAPSEVVKSVLDTARTGAKEEIFVDVVEKLTAIFDARGHVRSSSIVGAIKVKSYLGGNPPIRLGLPENVVLGQKNASTSSSSQPYSSTAAPPAVLDTYSLHEAVNVDLFDKERIIELVPPEGAFDLLTYRSSCPYRPPFRVVPLLEDDAISPDKLTLYLRIRAEYDRSKVASGLELTVPLPKSVQRVHCETSSGGESSYSSLSGGGGGGGGGAGGGGSGGGGLLGSLPLSKGAFGQQADFDAREHRLVWALKNVKGGSEHLLRVRLTIDPGSLEMARHEYGPVQVQFVLPGKPSASGMDVKYLRILKEEKGYNPARWFRVVALAGSYQIRTG